MILIEKGCYSSYWVEHQHCSVGWKGRSVLLRKVEVYCREAEKVACLTEEYSSIATKRCEWCALEDPKVGIVRRKNRERKVVREFVHSVPY